MNILYISHMFPSLSYAHGGVFVYDQLRSLAKKVNARLLVPVPFYQQKELCKAPEYQAEPLPYFRLPRHILWGSHGRFLERSLIHRVRSVQKSWSVDLIHAHAVYDDGFAAVRVGKKLGIPVVVTAHGSDVLLAPNKNSGVRRCVQFAVQHAQRIVAVSGHLQKALIDLGAPESQVRVIPNGYDPALFQPTPRAVARENLNLPVRGPIVLFVGSLTPIKAPDVLLQAFRCVADTFPSAHLVLVGQGPLRDQVFAWIRELGLEASVRYVGPVPHHQISPWMAAADVMCLPSRSEGFPTVLFEALASGTPIVASRVGGIPECICSEQYGQLVEPGDVNGLADALTSVLSTGFSREELVAYAAKHTWEHVADELVSLYRDVLSEGSRGV